MEAAWRADMHPDHLSARSRPQGGGVRLAPVIVR